MGTNIEADRVGAALFSKNRRAILALLYGHSDQEFYLRQIVRATGGGVGAVQREVRQLADAGVIRRTVRGNQVYFQAERNCPVFEDLKGLVIKTSGVADLLKVALAPLADRILTAFVFGSIVRSQARHDSDIDVLVVGDVSFSEVVAALHRAQDNLRREVNPVVYPPAEFRAKLAAGHHFLGRMLRQPKIFLIGGESELAGLAAERLADGA